LNSMAEREDGCVWIIVVEFRPEFIDIYLFLVGLGWCLQEDWLYDKYQDVPKRDRLQPDA